MADAIDQAATCKDDAQVRGDWQCRSTNRIGMGDHSLLDDASGGSAGQAKEHVDARWHARAVRAPGPVERHFVEAAGKVKVFAVTPKRGKRRGG